MKRKFFSLFLVLCMVLSLMPATVFAAVTASVTVGGVVFSSTGEGDISYATTNASGTVTTEGATSENYNIKFENGTLTLKDAAITKDIIGYGGGISTDQGDLDLVLEGTSRIAVTGSGEGARGIYIFGDLSIRGDGELTINSHSDGIYVNGDLAISGGTVNAAATGMNNGLCALGTGGNINITGGTVNALGIGAGIYGAESVAVSGNATVTAQGEAHYGLQGGQYADNFSISGSAVVTAIGAAIDATALKAVTGNTTHIILAGADADSAAKQPERLLDSGNTYKYVQLQPGQPDPDYVMKVDLDGEGGNDPVFYESFVDGWNAAINGNTAATTVKLLADWTADENGYFSSVASDGFHNGAGTADGYTGSIRIPSGKTVALDLNGHTIDRNLKSEVANGYAIVVNGTLTLQDSVGTGTITGGCDSEVGGVSVYSGAFTMEGGSISGNKGAGVYVLRSGSKFIMKGGTIQNNSGYGVYYSSTGGRVNLSGTPVIKENTTGNLYLSSGTSVTIDTEGLETGADIGVSFSTWPDENSSKTVATGSSGTDAGYFHSDKTGYELYDDNSDSTVKLRIGGDGAEARWGVAGADGSVPSSWTRGTLADAVTYAEGLRSGTAYIQLLSDVNNAYLYVSGGKAAVLDLNGKTLDRGLSGKAAVDGGCAITVSGGTLTLKDSRTGGKITGGNNSAGAGGVCVRWGGVFNMEGGIITGNRATYGGGVFVAQNSIDGRDSYFHMTGGSITGNDSTVYGGGVRIAEYSAMTISGGATIQDNFKGGTLSGGVYVQGSGEKSNTVLNGKAITVTGTLTGSIGVVKEDDYLEGKDSIQIAQSDISYQITQSDAARFTSDSSDCTTAYSNIGSKPVVLLKLPVVYNVTYNANGAASGSVPTDSTDYAAGSSVTVLANSGNLQKACGTFGGWNTKADGSGDSYAAGSGSFSISADTVLYAQWTEAHTFDADGFCEASEGETHFQPAVLNGDVYEISNAGQLYWFAEKVNGGDKTINGKLMKDIDLSVSRTIPWVPIGQKSVYYLGSFNGDGHTVSNLYINNEADYQGFFGKLNGSLTSLTVTGEIHSRSYAGGICGNMGTNGSISNCTNAADILSTGNWVGGIVGYNYGEISNCRNLADIQGARTVGGICGFNNQAKDWDAEPPVVTSWGTIKNCYNTGAVTGAAGSEAGGICGTSTPAKGTALFDNYCIDSVTYGCCWSTDGAKGFLKGAVESKTAEQFASGEVTYLLNNGKTDGTQVWLQAIGTDSLPQFTGAAVYQVEQYDCPADATAAIAYSNTDSEIRGTEHSFTHYTSNDDATCTADGTKTAQCDYCDETNTVADVGSMREHNCEHHEAKAATCTEIGWEAYDTCKDCDYTTYVETPAKGHSYVPHVEVPATHKADGIAGHFTCENCKKLFNKNKNEVTAENLVIAKLSHSFSGEWKSDEANHWHACSCGEKSSLLAHTFAWVTDKEATKTAAGSKHEKCTVCGYEKAAVEIPATGTSAPRTGDTSNMGLWIVLLFVSATGIIGAAVYGEKRKKQAK